MKLLVIADDIWHPVETIRRGLELYDDNNIEFDIVCTAKDILTPDFIAQYPIIIICKGDCINAANSAPWFEEGVTEVGPRELGDYVANGGNLIVIHAGCDINPEWLEQNEKFTRPCREYIKLIGCHFVNHPPRCPVTVRITDRTHPITKDVEDFTCRDEHYIIETVTDDIHTLFETVSESGGIQTGGYIREHGGGKIVLFTPGHTFEVWINPEWQKLLKNTIDWCLSAL